MDGHSFFKKSSLLYKNLEIISPAFSGKITFQRKKKLKNVNDRNLLLETRSLEQFHGFRTTSDVSHIDASKFRKIFDGMIESKIKVIDANSRNRT